MKILLLTYRYLLFHRLRTLILITALTLTLVLPVSVHWLIESFNEEMVSRAKVTPLLIGTKGSAYDLILNNVYFILQKLSPLNYGELKFAEADKLSLGIPLNIKCTSRKFPIIGTTLEYFDFRKLTLASGTFFQMLGDAVIGSKFSRKFGIQVGDTIISDPVNLYDISRVYPLKMHVAGILNESKTPDDEGVFTDVKTSWIIEGIGHGHSNVSQTASQDILLARSDSNVAVNDSIVQFNEITPENIGSFHFHGNEGGFPLTGIIAIPKDAKTATILKGRYGVATETQIVQPLLIIEDLMRVIFRIRTFFDLVFSFIAVSTILFLTLVMLLSVRLRKKEMEILYKLGCGRKTMFWMYSGEILILLSCGGLLAIILSAIFVLAAPDFHKFI